MQPERALAHRLLQLLDDIGKFRPHLGSVDDAHTGMPPGNQARKAGSGCAGSIAYRCAVAYQQKLGGGVQWLGLQRLNALA